MQTTNTTITLNQRPSNVLAVGLFDGVNATLAFIASSCSSTNSTSNNAITFAPLSHSPNFHQSNQPRIHFPPLTTRVRTVRFLAAARVLPSTAENSNCDFLIIATDSALWLFNVFDNCDAFYIDIPNGGVQCVCVSPQKNDSTIPVIYAALDDFLIQGYNYKGEEVFWTMTGDIPISLAIMDMNRDDGGDGEYYLIVASEDSCVRLFSADECIQELDVKRNAVALCPLSIGKIGFMLDDGTIGIMTSLSDTSSPVWKYKPTVQVTNIHGFSFTSDNHTSGIDEKETKNLVVGYTDGTLEVRCGNTGEILWADGLDGSKVVNVSSFDGPAGACLCVTLESGVVHVFNSLDLSGDSAVDICQLLEAEIEELAEKKNQLLVAASKKSQTLSVPLVKNEPKFSCKLELFYDQAGIQDSGCYLIVDSFGDCVITGVAVEFLDEDHTSEFLYVCVVLTGQTYITDNPVRTFDQHNTAVRHKLKLPRVYTKTVDVNLRVLYTSKTANTTPNFSSDNQTRSSVWKQVLSIPQFAVFKSVSLAHVRSSGRPLELAVWFHSTVGLSEVIKWITSSFLDTTHVQESSNTKDMEAAFIHTTTDTPIILKKSETKFTIESQPSQSSIINVISEIIQSYSKYLNISSVKVVTNKRFGSLQKEMERLFDKVHDLRAAQESGLVNALDSIPAMKALMQRVNSCCEIEDIKGAQRDAATLFERHRAVCFEYTKSLHHSAELDGSLDKLKEHVGCLAGLQVAPSEKSAILGTYRDAILNGGSGSFESLMTAFP
ncbi:hypothetical protein BDR26DRAFT_1006840 [Obelidium mucronatum]|nr:hypothetical protein BDR26DRAFT_1006840 [Obelidium mucronatum]